jgi:hypothetical protein
MARRSAGWKASNTTEGSKYWVPLAVLDLRCSWCQKPFRRTPERASQGPDMTTRTKMARVVGCPEVGKTGYVRKALIKASSIFVPSGNLLVFLKFRIAATVAAPEFPSTNNLAPLAFSRV